MKLPLLSSLVNMRIKSVEDMIPSQSVSNTVNSMRKRSSGVARGLNATSASTKSCDELHQ